MRDSVVFTEEDNNPKLLYPIGYIIYCEWNNLNYVKKKGRHVAIK